jgi:hypothetical protein
MARMIRNQESVRRLIKRPGQEETRSPKTSYIRPSDSCQIIQCRRSEKKADKWVSVKHGIKGIETKPGESKTDATEKMLKTVSIKVQLPPGLVEHSVRRFDVPEDKTVGIIEDNLADRFGVEKGHWKLYRSTEYGSKILRRNEPIKDYDMNATTLYFYPEY